MTATARCQGGDGVAAGWEGGTVMKPGGSELLADLRRWLGLFQRQIRASSPLAFRVHVPMVYVATKTENSDIWDASVEK